MWINTARNAGRVSRFHTKPLLHKQDIAQHSFNCSFIAMEIADGVRDIDVSKIIKYCLIHDLGEVYSGDASGEAKQHHPELKEVLDNIEKDWYAENLPSYLQSVFDLNKKEKVLVKISDLLEALLTSVIEVRIGNDALKPAVKQIWEALSEKLMEAKEIDLTVEDNADKILVWIESEYDSEIMKSVGEDN